MITDYPAFDALNVSPDYLTIGDNALWNLWQRGYITRPILSPEERAALQKRHSGARKIQLLRRVSGRRIV